MSFWINILHIVSIVKLKTKAKYDKSNTTSVWCIYNERNFKFTCRSIKLRRNVKRLNATSCIFFFECPVTNHLPSSKPETKKIMVPELSERGVHTWGLNHSFICFLWTTPLQPSLSAISHQLSETCWCFQIWQHHSFSALRLTSVFEFRDDTSPRSTVSDKISWDTGLKGLCDVSPTSKEENETFPPPPPLSNFCQCTSCL